MHPVPAIRTTVVGSYPVPSWLAAQVAVIDAPVLQVDEANLPGRPEDGAWALGPVNRVLDAARGERAVHILGVERIRWVHPDCGFWMLPRSVADRKLASLVRGRDLFVGALGAHPGPS